MKCPLACIGDYDVENIQENEVFDCLKEECAWFYEDTNCCILLRLGLEVAMISQRLKDIAKELTLIRPK